VISLHFLSPNVIVECLPERRFYATEVEAAIDEEWAKALSANATLFNGEVLTIDHVEIDANRYVSLILGQFIDYRTLVASRLRPELFGDNLPVPIGASALTKCRDGLIFGRRLQTNAFEGGRWELVPAGTVDRQSVYNGCIDIPALLLRELKEELGLEPSVLKSEPASFAIIQNSTQNSKQAEIAYFIEVSIGEDGILKAFANNENREHSDVSIIDLAELKALDLKFPTLLDESRVLTKAWLQRSFQSRGDKVN